MQTHVNSLQSIPDEVVWKSLANLVERFALKESEARILMVKCLALPIRLIVQN